MTQEQQTKLEGLSEEYANGFKNLFSITKSNLKTIAIDFKAGAQTILDNPSEWGLQDIEDSDERWCEVVDNFKQEADRYRRALETALDLLSEGKRFNTAKVIVEALKNNEG